MTTILTAHAQTMVETVDAEGDGLWLSVHEAARATGWVLKPEGFCKGDQCVPLPPALARELVREGAVDVAAFWRHMGWPVVPTASHDTWVLGTGAAARSDQLRSLEAPDFTLPDLAGTSHSLSSYRGRKVLVVSWASW